MSKIKETIEEKCLPEMVVTVGDMAEMVIRNACFSMEIIHQMAFCNKCGTKRI